MKLKITYVKTATLVPYVRNARTHSQAQVEELAGLIREFGFTNPVAIDANKGVIAGHGRLLAAEFLGMDEVPTIELSHLSERQKKAYILADNKIALKSGWDFKMLADEINDLVDLDVDPTLTGFNEQELDALLKTEASLMPEDFDDIPTPKKSRVAKKKEPSKMVHTCPNCGTEFSA